MAARCKPKNQVMKFRNDDRVELHGGNNTENCTSLTFRIGEKRPIRKSNFQHREESN